ncbi:hypothetical protein RRG08_066996 [Elysia crispata]|uniref:Uncharacterized protein n=1 Tax=Elysia crispata TaxID=231223 RepID=A0AAE1DD06_9GAST|nr:hypothetical protein RRG08_066996 [Elysia crispata]
MLISRTGHIFHKLASPPARISANIATAQTSSGSGQTARASDLTPNRKQQRWIHRQQTNREIENRRLSARRFQAQIAITRSRPYRAHSSRRFSDIPDFQGVRRCHATSTTNQGWP